jgi:hypothetical protein
VTGGPEGRARARRWIGALALGLLAIGAGLWLTRADAARAPHGDPAAAVAAAPPAAAPPAAAAVAAPPPDASAAPEDLPEPIRRFLAATPYPPSSGRLTPAHEDLLFPNRRYERLRPIPDTIGEPPEEQVHWLFTADRWAYVGPDTVHAWLEVRRGDTPIPVEIVAASALREGRAGLVGESEPLDFVREGDGLAADLPLHRFADHHGAIVLRVRFAWAPGREHEDALRIFSTPADRVPGRFARIHDALHDGGLRVGVDVDLEQGGFYRFDANVYGPDGEPVAFTSFKGELAPGAQTVPLDVYGKVLRDAGVPGPYTIGEVRGYRFLDGQFPDREQLPDLPARATTAAYPLDAFTDAPHVSAHERHMVELMREDLARGIPVLLPPLPGESEGGGEGAPPAAGAPDAPAVQPEAPPADAAPARPATSP